VLAIAALPHHWFDLGAPPEELGGPPADLSLIAVAAVGGASAHEHRTVAQGAYSMVVGWSGEPTFTGARNAVQLFVKDASGDAVTDLPAGTRAKAVSAESGSRS
jgi:hypothetical protein